MSLSDVPLSVFDLAPVVSGSTANIALRSTLDLAKQTDRLGYYRYWLAEHHGMPGVASSATAVVIGQVAAATNTIRIGSGGVMLPNHAPLVIAEQFGTLEAFYPGRIDLGIGRAVGGSQRAAQALRSTDERSAKTYPEQLDELIEYFEPGEGRAVRATPAEGNKPQVWLLGSSDFSAQLAGALGLPFSFAHHLKAGNMLSALESYRGSFRPSEALQRPHVMLSVAVIAADTDERAQWLAGPSKLKFLSRHHRRSILLPTPQEAATYPYTEADKLIIDEGFADKFVGSPETVHKRLHALLDDTGADELMVTTRVHDPADRLRSFELVAGLAR